MVRPKLIIAISLLFLVSNAVAQKQVNIILRSGFTDTCKTTLSYTESGQKEKPKEVFLFKDSAIQSSLHLPSCYYGTIEVDKKSMITISIQSCEVRAKYSIIKLRKTGRIIIDLDRHVSNGKLAPYFSFFMEN